MSLLLSFYEVCILGSDDFNHFDTRIFVNFLLLRINFLKMRYFLIFGFINFLLSGCSFKPISGHIELDDKSIHPMVYIVEPLTFSALCSSYEGKVIDSSAINDKGNFEFESVPNATFEKLYILTIQREGEKYPSKLDNGKPDSSNYIPFIYRPEGQVKINSKSSNFLAHAEIKGNVVSNEEIMNLIKNRINLHQKFHNKHAKDEHNLMDHELALYNFQNELVTSVENSNNVYLKALALRWASPSGDYERIPELVKETAKSLEKIAPNHAWASQIAAKSKLLPLTIGDSFPDFTLPMSNDSNSTIQNLLGSKITLIDLWASWCAPCRKENKNTLVPLWESMHEKGFQIIGYALDSDQKGWQSAIAKDGADRWPHASHLQGDDSPIFDSLRISTIPANYLIDNNRIIIAKNLHGEELIEFVEQWVSK
jgi:thiol-disulfide isomerase/thioredoxin